MTLNEIKAAVRRLTPEDRELLMLDLLEELSPEQRIQLDDLWHAEAGRRLAAMREGRLERIDGDDAFARAFAALNE